MSSDGHSSSSDSEDGFSLQRSQRRKKRRKLQADPGVKLQGKVNTLKADASAQTQCRPTNTGVTVKNGRSLKSAIKTLDKGHKEIYIGGVDSENSAEDVRDHLHKMGVRDAVVTELANRPNWKSFKAVVRDNVEKTALNNRYWSPGITARPFRKHELSQKERKQKGHLRLQSWLHETRPIKASSASSWSRTHHRNQHYGDRHNGYDNRRWNDQDGVHEEPHRRNVQHQRWNVLTVLTC